MSRAPCAVPYLIEQLVVETTVYPVDAHVSEEEEGQHAEEDTRPAWQGGQDCYRWYQEAVRVSWWETRLSHVRVCPIEVTASGCGWESNSGAVSLGATPREAKDLFHGGWSVSSRGHDPE